MVWLQLSTSPAGLQVLGICLFPPQLFANILPTQLQEVLLSFCLGVVVASDLHTLLNDSLILHLRTLGLLMKSCQHIYGGTSEKGHFGADSLSLVGCLYLGGKIIH